MGVVAAGTHELDQGPPAARRHPWPPPHPSDHDRQAAADPPGVAAAVADRYPDRPGRRRAAAPRGFGDRDAGGPLQVATGRPDRGAGPGAHWRRPAAGDLLAVDHSVLHKGAYPPTVLVNGQPVPAARRLHRGDRVTIVPGRSRIEPVTRVSQQLAANRPGNPMRSLATGPAQAVLDRGQQSGRMMPVAFHPAAGTAGPLPVALTFDDGPWPDTTAQILTILTQRQASATFFVIGRQVQRYPELVRQEMAAGMAVGSPSWTHPQPFDRLPVARIREEVARGRRSLQALGVRPVGFRPPGGATSPAVAATGQAVGDRTVLWRVDPAHRRPGAGDGSAR